MLKNKTGLFIAFGVGLIISDVIPTPADGLYFYLQQKNKQLLQTNKITPKQYWVRDALAYYGLNPLWWGGVIGTSLLIGKNYTQKRNILIGLVAGGLVVGVLNKNIQKDNLIYIKKEE
jgi:hypothetical protein